MRPLVQAALHAPCVRLDASTVVPLRFAARVVQALIPTALDNPPVPLVLLAPLQGQQGFRFVLHVQWVLFLPLWGHLYVAAAFSFVMQVDTLVPLVAALAQDALLDNTARQLLKSV